ncbi:hypothetical protein D7X30_03915 [Corallococcus sp. AB011P]|nr:hypothetical protein D7X30_03915 [Corallococcus sp. AB011P]
MVPSRFRRASSSFLNSASSYPSLETLEQAEERGWEYPWRQMHRDVSVLSASGAVAANDRAPFHLESEALMISIFKDSVGRLRNGWWILIFFFTLGALVVPATVYASSLGDSVSPSLQASLAVIAT